MIVYRSRIFSPRSDPFQLTDASETILDFEDGYLAVEDGRIVDVGRWSALPSSFAAAELVDFGRSTLISPGFVDAHLHGPQLEMIGSYGGHLLEWLNRYTFPTEAKFADPDHARAVASALFDELRKNGTLAALVFSTVHKRATEILFEEAERAGIRAIIGKAMMDRNAPADLLEDAEQSYRDSRDLIQQWHGRGGLLHYAISPRFAPTSTPGQLELAGKLKHEYPDVYIHSHVSENQSEVFWVKQLFPDSESYVGVYGDYGLLSDRTVLAHGVHLSSEELALLASTGTRICHCPNSNLFLGSGLFRLKDVLRAGVIVGLGSDIGAGTTPSMFNAMADAYKVQQVQGISLSPFHLWYLATLGGAVTLSLDAVTGSLEKGKEADFIVIDLDATPLLSLRTEQAAAVEDLLAGLIFMGDDRVVSHSFVRGNAVWDRDAAAHRRA